MCNMEPLSNLDFTTAIREAMTERLSNAIQYGSSADTERWGGGLPAGGIVVFKQVFNRFQ